MRKTLAATAVLLAAVTGCTPAPAAAPTPTPTPTPGALSVAAEDRTGYDRDRSGSYDRDALLAASLVEHGCYISLADDRCHPTPGEVDVDHIVALAEAWDSGASGWSPTQLDRFAGEPANLWLMTDNLNQSKGDDDVAEWLPPHEPAVCGYVETYAAVKAAYALSVDRAEAAVLAELAAEC